MAVGRVGKRFSAEARAIARSRRARGQAAWIKGGNRKRRPAKSFKSK